MNRVLLFLLIVLNAGVAFGQQRVAEIAALFMHRTAEVLTLSHRNLLHQDEDLLNGDFSRAVALQRYAMDSYEVKRYYEAIEYSYYAREEAFKVITRLNKKVPDNLKSYNPTEKKYITEYWPTKEKLEVVGKKFNQSTDKSYQHDESLKKIDLYSLD